MLYCLHRCRQPEHRCRFADAAFPAQPAGFLLGDVVARQMAVFMQIEGDFVFRVVAAGFVKGFCRSGGSGGRFRAPGGGGG